MGVSPDKYKEKHEKKWHQNKIDFGTILFLSRLAATTKFHIGTQTHYRQYEYLYPKC